MVNKQGCMMLNKIGQSLISRIGLSLLVLLVQSASLQASDLALTGIDVAALAGGKLQIELELNGTAATPKIFHTDNPARIALDFPGVKNSMPKKMYPVNQGAVSSIYVAEAPDRVRVIVNLLESTPYQTKIVDNKVILSLNNENAITPVAQTASPSVTVRKPFPASASLMPEQTISGFDFKRGENGEGRILVSLANPNTIVNSKEEGGKVVISFLNTRLQENLSKRLDVTEFATPVKFIDTASSSQGTTVTVEMQNNLYDYSLFQSEGLLTVEFRALTPMEKEILESKRPSTQDRLSLNFQDIEIRSVIAILAEFTGQNIVAGDEVTGNVTLKLDDVPWDEALNFIMMSKGLEKFESDNITMIAPVGKIKDYKEKQQATEAVVEQLEPLSTEYIKINYARAENFRNLFRGNDSGAFGTCGTTNSSGSTSAGQAQINQGMSQFQSQQPQTQYQSTGQNQSAQTNSSITKNDQFALLSSRGSAVVDARTNTLIVRETPKRLEEMKKLIRSLDVPVRQVMIESRIVSANNDFARELGVRFGVAKQGSDYAIGGAGTRTTTAGTQIVTDQLVNLATKSNPYGALGMTLARGADYVLNLEISALQDQGLGELVSNPRVMTSDRCKATIKQGTQIAYQVSSPQSGPTTQLVDAVLQLDVTPQITPSGSVVMALKVTKDAPLPPLTDNSLPPIDTRQLETNVHVMDGETVVLGGVFEGRQSNNTNKVPFFADLPGIGFLFKRNFTEDKKSELLIFITPKIVKAALANN
ncbi:MAG: type IV pilus secretin PilQ [Methylococcaceae bacterium]|nr:type IV pilus secretin PilQ [Methylococcaceae bacterium]